MSSPFRRFSRPYNCCCQGVSLKANVNMYEVKKPSSNILEIFGMEKKVSLKLPSTYIRAILAKKISTINFGRLIDSKE